MESITPDPGTQPPASDRIRRIQAEIEDLKKRMPAHSVPPSMFQRLEELEEELENELRKN
jgi:hypothetical protein